MNDVYSCRVGFDIMSATEKVLQLSQLYKNVDKTNIIIKPNILSEQLPPKTTDPFVVLSLVKYLRENIENANITIAEGCFSSNMTTLKLFDVHRYNIIAKRFDVKLLDLNNAPSTERFNDDAKYLKSFWVSDVLNDAYVISVPALKGHGMVTFTGALKNMFGVAPSYKYRVKGHARKFKLHGDISNSIVDISRYIPINYALMDGSIGLRDHHIKGTPCNPPLNVILGGYDPVAVDACAIDKLFSNKSWQDIKYMRIAHGAIGDANYKEIPNG